MRGFPKVQDGDGGNNMCFMSTINGSSPTSSEIFKLLLLEWKAYFNKITTKPINFVGWLDENLRATGECKKLQSFAFLDFNFPKNIV